MSYGWMCVIFIRKYTSVYRFSNNMGNTSLDKFKQEMWECFGKVHPINLEEYSSCAILHKITRRIFAFIGKHVDVSSKILLDPQLGDNVKKNIALLQTIKQRKPTFLCLNDGMRLSSGKMEPILKNFYEEFFPEKSLFEEWDELFILPPLLLSF